MSVTPPPNGPPTPGDAVRAYELVCLLALVVMLAVLVGRGHGLWCVLPLLVGSSGIVWRWSTALPLTLVALSFVVLNLWRFRGLRAHGYDFDPLGDFLLCAAVLGYAIGQHRLQAAASQLVPEDPRSRRKAGARGDKTPPAPRRLLDAEIFLLVLALPACALLAGLAWEALPPNWSAVGLPLYYRRLIVLVDLPPALWRLVVLVWLLGLALLLRWALGVALNWGRRGRTPEEAALYLQDVLWNETRREHRRLYRWLAWARLRPERRKEGP